MAFFISMRRGGTTSLLRKIADENDVYVLVPTSAQKKEFGDKAITLEELHNNTGRKAKPVLVDNYTMILLSEDGIKEFEKLRKAFNERQRMLRDIDVMLERFKNTDLGLQSMN